MKRGRENVGKSRVGMGKGGGGAEQMKIKKLCLEEATEKKGKKGLGGRQG